MRRLYITVALFLFLIATGLFSLLHVMDTNRDIVEQIDVIMEIGEEPERLMEELDRLEEIWVSHRNILYHHIHHKKLDEISVEIVRARNLAKEEEYSYMREALGTTRWLVGNVLENEVLQPDNIF